VVAALIVYGVIGVGYVVWLQWRHREHFRRAKQRLADLIDGEHAGMPISQGRLAADAYGQLAYAIWMALWPVGVALDIRDACQRRRGAGVNGQD